MEIRDYQLNAIQALKDNEWSGILEMATGTGKTFTSLHAAREYQNERGRIFLVIVVPFVHLIPQWKEACEITGFQNFTFCYRTKKTWLNKLHMDIRDFNIGILKQHVVITTYRTASSPEFNMLISDLKDSSMVIADECHYLGTSLLKNTELKRMTAKIGLSATPDRWWDEVGTKFIGNLFGGTVFTYDMEEAIQNGYLTEYCYTPILVKLTSEELANYDSYTKRLVKLFNQEPRDYELIQEISRRRALVLSRATEKKQLLHQLLLQQDVKELKHTLVYCAPGEITEIVSLVANMGFRVHKFDSTVSMESRQTLLKQFEQGDIQILVAIKCLDEGVDVPMTKIAYFLASTSNPREFVQRRGRVLRKANMKKFADIYDFIVLPNGEDEIVFQSIAGKEIPRFAEFSRFAINKYVAREKVRTVLQEYSLEYLMDKLPWEIYREMREEFDKGEEY